MEITYEKNGDYLVPNLMANPEPEEALTKYGLMRRSYLQAHRGGTYQALLLKGKLKSHCLEIQKSAEKRMELLVRQMAEKEGVTEKLKADDQMGWVAKMNSIRSRAEEIVLDELIYS